MYLCYKYKLYPTKEQAKKLEKTLELCCWVYNEILSYRKNAYEKEQKSLNYYSTIKLLPQWKKDKTELKEVNAQALQNVVMRVDKAFKNFFRRVKKGGENPGYPRTKETKNYRSFTYPQPKIQGAKLKEDEGLLYLAKIGNIKIKLHRPLQGNLRTTTICKKGENWYAYFLCKIDEIAPLPSSEAIGIDLGLTTFAVFSNGEKIERQRWDEKDKKDIARLQRKKLRYSKGSKEREKVIKSLEKAYRRASNRRENFAHQESRKLVNRFGLIVFEKLNIQSMQRQKISNINRGINDVSWKKFISYTVYKAKNMGRSVLLVDPAGTSQICSRCGDKSPKRLSERTHRCSSCGLKMDRDLNAAINILGRGLASIGTQPDKDS
jgi:putative transposase